MHNLGNNEHMIVLKISTGFLSNGSSIAPDTEFVEPRSTNSATGISLLISVLKNIY